MNEIRLKPVCSPDECIAIPNQEMTEIEQNETSLQQQLESATSPFERMQIYLDIHYQFKLNKITNRLLMKSLSKAEDFHYLEDYEFNSILRDLKLSGLKSSKEDLRTLLYSNYVRIFDVFEDYLNNLPEWDGNDYIAELAKSVVTTQPKHFEFCLRKWLVAMVASLLDENVVNHTAIILSGPQGIGKTSWFHTIIPAEFQEFVHEGYIQTKDKEVNVKIAECILVLMDELENLSDKSMDSVKQLMTQKGTAMRRAYTTMSQYYTRRASFAGTVNKKHFLKDLTGNRRFLCFEVKSIDLEHKVPLNQLYAQLKHMTTTDFQYWFDEKEIALLNEMNEEFRDISLEEEVFKNCFDICQEGESDALFLPTTQIIQLMEQKTGSKGITAQRLGRVLKELKVVRLKRKDRYGYLIREKIF